MKNKRNKDKMPNLEQNTLSFEDDQKSADLENKSLIQTKSILDISCARSFQNNSGLAKDSDLDQ